ncbi:WbqC family protein [Gaetbulibacter aquiaggeris]|uniref:WbqC family protein n=1 Tax=Gaetbulibacter aquiaggeris TaxID=1735373 RepID=A0ABW7MTP7_9FLAO
MNILIHPTYFPNIAHFVAIVKADKLTFEYDDNFVKQTYRNRTYIYAANGKLLLNIPVVHSQKDRKKYKDVKISQETSWQSHHWKSLLSAYSTSPFFEYYQDELIYLFKTKTKYLLDFNLNCFEAICDCLQFDSGYSKTDDYQKIVKDTTDFRYLVNAKIEDPQFEPYSQVFDDKHGFINNLSVLDLLFNEGPNALSYLESQSTSII